ncbi:uncharacterized protein CDV56_103736 [Aspergillus thermomutatus]|uniref:Uncharacterized protein n=1 Tax=Aspergillus thermomutatus TaxID=41047 RepID=A0A397GBY0_ASPTH|nr:uncharacterized protein CDV56_103736 [Aspergillus thermomutatus]RHZ46473.1 hypothetical protein CDV56_103736 [Aspergillus thermomutatus]
MIDPASHKTTPGDDESQLQDPVSLSDEDIWKAFRHHSPGVVTFPSVLAQIPIQRTLNPTVPEPPDGRFRFEYAEHTWLGNAIPLRWHDGTTKLAKEILISLPNGLRITYGTINALAGDFYAMSDPICEGPSLMQRQDRFRRSFDFLASDPKTPAEAQELMHLLQLEIDRVNEALRQGKSVPEAYYSLGDMTAEFLTIMSKYRPIGSGKPDYLRLAKSNLDHFGEGARMAYDAGHSLALEVAAKGTPQALELGYAMNAFADHFLEDQFAAGHLRTPRKALSGIGVSDLCSKYMHDEDNAIGLQVSNPHGETWTAYGDKKLLTGDDAENQKRCHQALMASADEVYDAWTSRKPTPIGLFKAWNHAPTLQSAQAKQEHEPLFNPKAQVRTPFEDRRSTNYTSVFNWVGLYMKFRESPVFKEPIRL